MADFPTKLYNFSVHEKSLWQIFMRRNIRRPWNNNERPVIDPDAGHTT